ncbi:MAG TPA: hypothetical protein VE967_09245 [Gemmatimonadaceae bacterium]|nr:hypothetical protein [Gemmatimonadaceae bacterium]
MRRFALTLMVAAACAAPAANAQLGGPPRAKALTRPENWGLTFGLGFISPVYDPSGPQDFNYATRGQGLSLTLGLVFNRYFIFGGEIGSVFFSGDKRLISFNTEYPSETTNSVVGSAYAGVITSPMGRSPKLGRKWWVGTVLGASTFSGERRLDGCTTCLHDRLHMTAGPYIEPFFMFGGGDRDGGGGVRASYRAYLGAAKTVQSAISVGLFFDFIKL